MSNVSLSNAVRQNLFALQGTADMMSMTQNRLATGKKVNSAMDNATSFFTSSALNSRANDMSNLLDGISNATKTLEAADNGIKAITKLVESAQSTAKQARATTDAARRTELQGEYDALMTQIDELASDSGFNGVNLLDSDTSDVAFNEDGSNKITLTGVDGSSTGLAINAGDLETDNASIDAALTGLADALVTLRGNASTFGSNMTVLQTRQNFTKATINTLKAGADNLVNADINEEAATLLALQTRQQLSSTALSMSNQQDQAVMRLFG